MGDFTMRFDREILRSRIAEIEAQKQKERKAQAEQDRLSAMLAEIGEILERRARFIEERFPNARREPLQEVGFSFTYEPRSELREARFSMVATLNSSQLAIRVESRYEVPATSRSQFDYIAIPTTLPDVDRARRFIEAKLLEFAREYMG